ncbi:hypothetical protein [Algisphaera agarilytica]|uniref:Uncharacterized protein n=1 Tax=Algisphaera agarilytica TaxID=1385975 RepID=A0A7X0H9B0_9BACT|nr:hypothetical protein [Algisphaera agarilytica]MBB6430149.1 hypothetical protein [Algisphaera agarilytica]
MNDFNPDNLTESTPTDPRLDALLDDALAPADLPVGLNDRILAATADRLPGGKSETFEEAPAVIGRIGGGVPWRSIAAVLLFALVIGGVWVANQESDTTDPVPPTHNVAGVDPSVALESLLAELAETENEVEWIDDRIDMLSMQVTLAQDTEGWGDEALDALDNAIAMDTFDDIADELEWYF